MILTKRIRTFAPKVTTLNTIEISRSALLHNLALLQQRGGGIIFPVLKSNAYGHGLPQVSSMLSKTSVPYICVDSFPEYQIVRSWAKKPVLVLGETNPENYHLYKYDATLVISSLETLRVVAAMRHPRKIHLFLNTGMHREWLQTLELAPALTILATAKHLHLEGVMSHLACADDRIDTHTPRQVALFHTMYQQILDAWFSPYWKYIANSAGISTVHDPLFNAGRAWIARYGYSPFTVDHPNAHQYSALRPALRVWTTIVWEQIVPTGESVSYGATYTAGTAIRTATLPFWYYEWLPRAVSNQWNVRRGQHVVPVRGRVCMNLCCIDTLGLPMQRGDRIEIISPDRDAPNTIEALATMTQTIPYEVLVKLNEKIRRVIVP